MRIPHEGRECELLLTSFSHTNEPLRETLRKAFRSGSQIDFQKAPLGWCIGNSANRLESHWNSFVVYFSCVRNLSSEAHKTNKHSRAPQNIQRNNEVNAISARMRNIAGKTLMRHIQMQCDSSSRRAQRNARHISPGVRSQSRRLKVIFRFLRKFSCRFVDFFPVFIPLTSA